MPVETFVQAFRKAKVNKEGENKQIIEELYNMLYAAAELEQGLMLPYLYSAYSLKTRWEELQYIRDKQGNWIENSRATIQFDLLRECRKALINVAREEMFHLHLVNYLIRALGGSPHFSLPTTPDSDTQVFPLTFQNWKPWEDVNPLFVELEKCSSAEILRYIQFESTPTLMLELAKFEAGGKEPEEILAILEGTYEFDLDLKCYYAFDTANESDPNVQKLLHVWKRTPVRAKQDEKDEAVTLLGVDHLTRTKLSVLNEDAKKAASKVGLPPRWLL